MLIRVDTVAMLHLTVIGVNTEYKRNASGGYLGASRPITEIDLHILIYQTMGS